MTLTTFKINTSSDDQFIQREGTAYPPTGTITRLPADGLLWVYKGKTTPYVVTNTLLAFDTSALPENCVISAATIKAKVNSVKNVNSKFLTAEYYNWSGSADTDHRVSAAGNANAGMALSSMTPGAILSMPLANPDTNISRVGDTRFVLHLSDGIPTGENQVVFYSFDHATEPEPELIVDYFIPLNSSAVKIYVSTDGSNYSLVKTVNNPQSANWTTDIPFGSLAPPNPPPIAVSSIIENAITLGWTNPGNPSTRRWFKASNIVNKTESAATPSRDITASPSIVRYVLQRKIEGQTDDFYVTKYDGTATGFTDTTVIFGEKYTYRVTAYNNLGQASTHSTKNATAALPNPTTFLTTTVVNQTNGSQIVRLAGKFVENATAIEIQKSTDNITWSILKNAKLGIPPGGFGDEEWWEEDSTIQTIAPNVPVWALRTSPVDTDGVHLKWAVPTNAPSTINYRALRKFNTVASVASIIKSATIQPSIQRYDIQRRETPVAGTAPTPENNWKTIKTIASTAAAPVPATTYDDNEVLFSKSYDYRIVAFNNFGVQSQSSIVKTLSTFDAPPPPPPPAPPVGAVIGNGRPTGSVEITQDGFLRIAWDYSHSKGEKPVSFTLKAIFTDDLNVVQTRWWNGVVWSTDSTSKVNSSQNFADISPSIFTDGRQVDLYLQVTSTNGGVSNIYG